MFPPSVLNSQAQKISIANNRNRIFETMERVIFIKVLDSSITTSLKAVEKRLTAMHKSIDSITQLCLHFCSHPNSLTLSTLLLRIDTEVVPIARTDAYSSSTGPAPLNPNIELGVRSGPRDFSLFFLFLTFAMETIDYRNYT